MCKQIFITRGIHVYAHTVAAVMSLITSFENEQTIVNCCTRHCSYETASFETEQSIAWIYLQHIFIILIVKIIIKILSFKCVTTSSLLNSLEIVAWRQIIWKGNEICSPLVI